MEKRRTPTMVLVPTPGATVLDPAGRVIPPEGATVPKTPHFLRVIRRGNGTEKVTARPSSDDS